MDAVDGIISLRKSILSYVQFWDFAQRTEQNTFDNVLVPEQFGMNKQTEAY